MRLMSTNYQSRQDAKKGVMLLIAFSYEAASEWKPQPT